MKVLPAIICLFVSIQCFGQGQGTTKYLSFDDLANFWQAYDKVVLIKDSAEQVKIIQTHYLDKASYVLRTMLILFNYNAPQYLAYIKAYPAFWVVLRERSRILMGRYKELVHVMKRLREIYHHFYIPDIDFMVGRFEFGGKPIGNNVLIAAEVAFADGNLDISSYKDDSTRSDSYTFDAALYFILHESIHTAQPIFSEQDLLSLCIMEGSCDFIAELAMKRPLDRPYIILGNKFEKKIWERFRKQMNGFEHDDWLYNKGLVEKGEEDLGYFMGYMICKNYYEKALNKRKAIHRIIQLNFSSNTAIYKFFLESGYENKFR